MNRKIVILVVFLIFLIALLIFFLLFNQQKKSAPTTIIASPTPTITQPYLTPPAAGALGLTSIEPVLNTGTDNPISPAQRLTFTFNKEVDAASLNVTVVPEVNLEKVFTGQNKQLVIQPSGIDFWKPNTTYKITISKGLKAKDGSELVNDITYSLKVVMQGGE